MRLGGRVLDLPMALIEASGAVISSEDELPADPTKPLERVSERRKMSAAVLWAARWVEIAREVVQLSMIIAQLRRVLGVKLENAEFGEAVIATFGTCVSALQLTPSEENLYESSPLLLEPW